MAKIEKLIERFLSVPKDFTWEELTKLLNFFGYTEQTGGISGGSRRKYINANSKHVIIAHKPHPKNLIKRYLIEQIINVLKQENLL